MSARRRSSLRSSDLAAANGTTEKVDASPSKSLFIDMLVRDIELRAAVGDLADNAIDGARRVLGETAAEKGNAFKGLFLEIDVSGECVALRDNCGGIALKDPRWYGLTVRRPGTAKGLSHPI